MKAYRVLLYYRFAHVADPAGLAERQQSLCERLGLRGRILIAEEGINGTVSGSTDSCELYMHATRQEVGFESIDFKIDEADEHAFKKLFVRVRPEIITLGRALKGRVEQGAATRLTPVEWRKKLDEDVVILDGRNAYESEMGRFKGAICPQVRNFRDFPSWLEAHRAELKDKPILTYCTGGIRCEKLSTWMLENGFENVFQLEGGIVKYGQDRQVQGEGFEGVNVVFDERVAVSAGPRSEIITTCRECGSLSANYVNCANVFCNLRMIQCPACEEKFRRCCSDECRESPRQRKKGKKWHESRHAVS